MQWCVLLNYYWGDIVHIQINRVTLSLTKHCIVTHTWPSCKIIEHKVKTLEHAKGLLDSKICKISFTNGFKEINDCINDSNFSFHFKAVYSVNKKKLFKGMSSVELERDISQECVG